MSFVALHEIIAVIENPNNTGTLSLRKEALSSLTLSSYQENSDLGLCRVSVEDRLSEFSTYG